MAVLDENAVIIHGHSVKGIQRVVRCYANENEMSSDLDVKETKWYLVSLESAMFFAHPSHFGYAVHLLPERGFSYRSHFFEDYQFDVNGISVYQFCIYYQ